MPESVETPIPRSLWSEFRRVVEDHMRLTNRSAASLSLAAGLGPTWLSDTMRRGNCTVAKADRLLMVIEAERAELRAHLAGTTTQGAAA